MKGGLCPVHRTPLSGFNNLVFCVECDLELEEKNQEGYNTDEIDLLLSDEADTLVEETVGYIVSFHAIKTYTTTLSPSDNIWLKKPDMGNSKGFVYKVNLKDIKYNITADGKTAYPTGIYQGIVLERI